MITDATMAERKKERRGPRLGQPSQLKQSKALMIRVTEEQKRLFDERAGIHGLNTGAWARMILLRQVRVGQKEDAE